MNAMKFTSLLLFLGLLWGAREVNEALIVLRAAEVASHPAQAGAKPAPTQDGPLGELIVSAGLALVAHVAPGMVTGIDGEARRALLQGIGLVGACTLGLGVLSIRAIRHGNRARGRTRKRTRPS